MCIRRGTTSTSIFTVSNGVKQGGVLSPVIFNVYMDDRSTRLCDSNIAGHISYKFNGMQHLLDIMLLQKNIHLYIMEGMCVHYILS